MNAPSKDEEKDAKQAKIQRTARTVWMILIPIFAAVILWELYSYANGKDNLRGIMTPLGMIFLGVASIVDERSKMLKSILLVAAMIIIISGLIMAIVY